MPLILNPHIMKMVRNNLYVMYRKIRAG